jgi:hypothetical protein
MEEFVNSNGTMYSKWEGEGENRRYIVYSHRTSWPVFVYSSHLDKWWENQDKVSTTTSRHLTQAHPHTVTEKISVHLLRLLADAGPIESVKHIIKWRAA